MVTWLGTLAAVAATYFFMCAAHAVRTRTSRHDRELSAGHRTGPAGRRAVEELRALWAQDALDSGRVTSSKPTFQAGG
jgi:hypothetical protein